MYSPFFTLTISRTTSTFIQLDTLVHNGFTVTVPKDPIGRVAIAASALHERIYLAGCRSAATGIRSTLVQTNDAALALSVSDMVEKIAFVGWDFPPSAALRIMEAGELQI